MDGMIDEDPVIPVFMPALVILLRDAERIKKRPLKKREVLKIRNKGIVVMIRTSRARGLAETRGFEDIDPRNCWEEWCQFRERMFDAEPS